MPESRVPLRTESELLAQVEEYLTPATVAATELRNLVAGDATLRYEVDAMRRHLDAAAERMARAYGILTERGNPPA